jgi:hypothetical protein
LRAVNPARERIGQPIADWAPPYAAKMVLNFRPVACSGLHVSPGFPNRTLAFRLTDKFPDIHERMPERPKVRILLAPPGSPPKST